MKNIITIAGRELRTYYSKPMGWLVLAAFLLITGFFYAAMVGYYSVEASEAGYNPYMEINLSEYLIAPFFGNIGVILLMICPALSMGLFAKDRADKSLELLLTAPVSTVEIVLGKYLGGMAFVGVMLLATVHYPAFLYWMGEPDTGVVLSSYLSTFLMVGSFMAIGILTSALTESQLVAMVLSFVMLLLFWVISWADSMVSGTTAEIITNLSMMSHMEQLGKGLLHVKDIAYYVSFIGFALFATWQRVEAYRWR